VGNPWRPQRRRQHHNQLLTLREGRRIRPSCAPVLVRNGAHNTRDSKFETAQKAGRFVRPVRGAGDEESNAHPIPAGSKLLKAAQPKR
jgi:hypothetical protein